MRLLRPAVAGLAMTLFLSSVVFPAEELNVRAQVDKSEVKQGEVLTYSITIAGSIQETPKVHLTAFEGFQVVSTGQSQQIQVAPEKSKLTLTLRYSLAPTAVGTHTLGPVRVEYKGQVYQTQPIEVKVAPGLAKRMPQPRGENEEPKPEDREEPSQEELPQLEGGVIL